MTLFLGIDDAGRGPLIGPMILAGVLVDKNQESRFKRLNVRDSKSISHPERVKLSKIIMENSHSYKIVKSFPDEIDKAITTGLNLNTLEAKKAAEIINSINSAKYHKEKIKVFLDCPSVNTVAWLNTLVKFIEHSNNLQFVCEHKADSNYVCVGAASILAKVVREEEVEKIKKEFIEYGDIGSGYPSDPLTKDFLKRYGATLSDAGIFRKTWATWRALFPKKISSQATLDKFGDINKKPL